MIGSGLAFNFANFFSLLIVVLIAMTVHEFAHCYVADRNGDYTARSMGKLTLNPMKHIYWPGFLMWVLIGFGVLGTAPVNESRMRNKRWGLFYAVAAGPLSNLGLAALAAILYRLNLWEYQPGFLPRQVLPSFSQFMTVWFSINMLLFIFNLIPLPPLDGWTILRKLMPTRKAEYTLLRYEREAMFLFLGLIVLQFVGINILGSVLGPIFGFFARLLLDI
jgi:Zn-dependent protease